MVKPSKDYLARQAEAMDALRDRVEVFIWYPADESSPEYPTQPVTQIDLGETEVTDFDLAHLRHFTELEWLCLEETQITDAGLMHLASLKRLRKLELKKTLVTDAGVTALQRALPNCEIVR